MEQIKNNKWYKVICEAARKQFIERCLNEHKGCKVDDNAWSDALLLRYNSKSNAINYRGSYYPQYMGEVEEYFYCNENKFIVKREDITSNNDDINDIKKLALNTVYGAGWNKYFQSDIYETLKIMEEKKTMKLNETMIDTNIYNPIVDKFYNKEREKVQKEYRAKMDTIIANSELGKVAKEYLDIMNKKDPMSVKQSLNNLVPFYMLTQDEQNKIRLLDQVENEFIKNINDTRDEVIFLLSQCDKYEQKEEIYRRYKILTNI